MTTSTLTAALARHRAATAAEAAARAADEQADEHLRRGRQELTNAAAELERVRAALKGTDERRSRLIAEKIQSGEPLPPFAAVDSLDDEERRASRRHDQLQTAVARLEATKRSAAAARAEAAAELEDAVAEILAADGERLAAEVERDEAALARKRNLLSALADRLAHADQSDPAARGLQRAHQRTGPRRHRRHLILGRPACRIAGLVGTVTGCGVKVRSAGGPLLARATERPAARGRPRPGRAFHISRDGTIPRCPTKNTEGRREESFPSAVGTRCCVDRGGGAPFPS